MARFVKALFVLSIATWLSIGGLQKLSAQQPVQVPDEPVRIGDFGLEARIPSAIDLVGPDASSAGRNRDLLAERLQCWIDGPAECAVADRNDPRVRAIRRFIGLGPFDRDGAVIVRFPDETRIEVRLARRSDPEPEDWDQRVYEAVVLPGSVRAPGLSEVPSRPGQFEGLAHEGAPAIEAALERLADRLEPSKGGDRTVPAAATEGPSGLALENPF